MTSFGIFAISQPNTNDSARRSEVPIQTCCVFLSCWPRHTHHSARWPPALRVCFLQAGFSDKNGRRGLRAECTHPSAIWIVGLRRLLFWFPSLFSVLSLLCPQCFSWSCFGSVGKDGAHHYHHQNTINNIIDMMFSNIVAAASLSQIRRCGSTTCRLYSPKQTEIPARRLLF